MATQKNISNYFSGEPFVVEATLTDSSDAPITSGTFTLQVATATGIAASYEAVGSHSGAGVWVFNIGAMTGLGTKAYYEINDSNAYILTYGTIDIKGTII
mgnify:CR=1 FL=1